MSEVFKQDGDGMYREFVGVRLKMFTWIPYDNDESWKLTFAGNLMDYIDPEGKNRQASFTYQSDFAFYKATIFLSGDVPSRFQKLEYRLLNIENREIPVIYAFNVDENGESQLVMTFVSEYHLEEIPKGHIFTFEK